MGLQFYKRNPRKKFQNRLQFSKEIPLKKFAFNFTWKSLYFFQKITSWRPFLKNSSTCPKFNTHKKIVVHFFIPMLLLPLTPFLTYLKLKKIKGPKMDSLFHFFTFHFHFFTFTFSLSLFTF